MSERGGRPPSARDEEFALKIRNIGARVQAAHDMRATHPEVARLLTKLEGAYAKVAQYIVSPHPPPPPNDPWWAKGDVALAAYEQVAQQLQAQLRARR